MSSDKPTRYAIICPEHGQVFMTREEYQQQMARPNSRWICPHCGRVSQFDDDNYDEVKLQEDGPPDTPEQKMWEPDPDDLLPPGGMPF